MVSGCIPRVDLALSHYLQSPPTLLKIGSKLRMRTVEPQVHRAATRIRVEAPRS